MKKENEEENYEEEKKENVEEEIKLGNEDDDDVPVLVHISYKNISYRAIFKRHTRNQLGQL